MGKEGLLVAVSQVAQRKVCRDPKLAFRVQAFAQLHVFCFTMLW